MKRESTVLSSRESLLVPLFTCWCGQNSDMAQGRCRAPQICYHHWKVISSPGFLSGSFILSPVTGSIYQSSEYRLRGEGKYFHCHSLKACLGYVPPKSPPMMWEDTIVLLPHAPKQIIEDWHRPLLFCYINMHCTNTKALFPLWPEFHLFKVIGMFVRRGALENKWMKLFWLSLKIQVTKVTVDVKGKYDHKAVNKLGSSNTEKTGFS